MQMFRVAAISQMVQAATDVFVANIQRIMSGEIEAGFELIKYSSCARLCKSVKDFDKRYGFQHRDVLKLELEGSNYISSMMDMLWDAISNGLSPSNPFGRYVYGEISENYRRVYDQSEKTIYDRSQLLCDVVSGMTESYLIKKHDEFRALQHAPR